MVATQMPAVGSIVRARGRNWVVLPPEEPSVVRLRPLTGRDDDAVGIFVPLEGTPRPGSFRPPDPDHAGDLTGGLLLRDAVRLSLRSSAAPFRSLGRLSVAPRPYQFVPLIMALRLDTVRLLIADDVGVGKTVEAAMVARELLDRGLARRLSEVANLRLSDLNFERKELTVREGKGKQTRVVDFVSKARDAVRNYLNSTTRRESLDDHLFLNRYGQPLGVRSIQKLVTKYVHRAGVDGKDISPHSLRHTWATVHAERGVPLVHIQHQAGHKHLSTTGRYIHEDRQHRAKLMEATAFEPDMMTMTDRADPGEPMVLTQPISQWNSPAVSKRKQPIVVYRWLL